MLRPVSTPVTGTGLFLTDSLVDSTPDGRTEFHLYIKEWCVGTSTNRTTYPGIQQCFAIAGWTQNGMICIHIPNTFRAQDMEDAFGYLADLGGRRVTKWYVVGPCTDHFEKDILVWKKIKDIKKTFKAHFKGAEVWLMDVSADRALHSWGVDIRADRFGTNILFAIKKTSKADTGWTELEQLRFTRL